MTRWIIVDAEGCHVECLGWPALGWDSHKEALEHCLEGWEAHPTHTFEVRTRQPDGHPIPRYAQHSRAVPE